MARAANLQLPQLIATHSLVAVAVAVTQFGPTTFAVGLANFH
jgi:hypothetical protein